MKKLILSSIIVLATTACFASDYIQQEVTSEVFTEQVTTTTESYQPVAKTHRVYRPDCRYDRSYCNKPAPASYKLKPVTVHTGRTVTVQDHYDVYQPRVVYDKVNSYTTTQVCEYCD